MLVDWFAVLVRECQVAAFGVLLGFTCCGLAWCLFGYIDLHDSDWCLVMVGFGVAFDCLGFVLLLL